jgi:hypothetical protein
LREREEKDTQERTIKILLAALFTLVFIGLIIVSMWCCICKKKLGSKKVRVKAKHRKGSSKDFKHIDLSQVSKKNVEIVFNTV